MMDSHHAAVESVMKYVEDNLVEARGRVDGTTRRMGTGNMIARPLRPLHFPRDGPAASLSRSRRQHDPTEGWQVAGSRKREDVRTRTSHRHCTRTSLPAELKERGYTVTMAKYDTGNSRYARIEGIDERIEDHFSKRQSQIDKVIAGLKERLPLATAGELRQMACLDTRQAKKTVDREVLHDSWGPPA